MKITVTFFFEPDTEHFSIQLATFARVANDWSKPRDEQNLDVTCALHGISFGSARYRFPQHSPESSTTTATSEIHCNSKKVAAFLILWESYARFLSGSRANRKFWSTDADSRWH